jgi:RNA polymerase sigma-70 factor (ECF subfamily)
MTPAVPQPATAPPDDPVRAALNDSRILDELRKHAHVMLSRWLADRAASTWAEEAGDVVQETQQRALTMAATFDAARSVAAWLHGILINVVSEHCRKLRKLPLQQPDDPADWDRFTRRVDPTGDTAELLELLPEKQRRFVTMHLLDGLSHREIGRRLNISEGNSRVQLTRALNLLRQLVAGREVER